MPSASVAAANISSPRGLETERCCFTLACPKMADEDLGKERTLEVAGTASNEIEADLLRQRLAAAGIQAVSQRSIGGPQWGVSGGQYVYVEAADLDRAREILSAPEDISDEDLTELSEGGPPRG
jgi:hypothetical protein